METAERPGVGRWGQIHKTLHGFMTKPLCTYAQREMRIRVIFWRFMKLWALLILFHQSESPVPVQRHCDDISVIVVDRQRLFYRARIEMDFTKGFTIQDEMKR